MMPRTKGSTAKTKVAKLKAQAPRSLNDYDAATISKAFKLYLLYNGTGNPKVVAEMQKEYPWFTLQRLESLIQKYNWKDALQTKIATDSRQALTSADELVEEIETVRKKLYGLIKGAGQADKELIAQHIHYCRLSVEALVKVKEARDTFGAWLAFWERLLEWLPDLSPHALEALLQVSDALIERAAKEYGTGDEEEPDENDD